MIVTDNDQNLTMPGRGSISVFTTSSMTKIKPDEPYSIKIMGRFLDSYQMLRVVQVQSKRAEDMAAIPLAASSPPNPMSTHMGAAPNRYTHDSPVSYKIYGKKDGNQPTSIAEVLQTTHAQIHH